MSVVALFSWQATISDSGWSSVLVGRVWIEAGTWEVGEQNQRHDGLGHF